MKTDTDFSRVFPDLDDELRGQAFSEGDVENGISDYKEMAGWYASVENSIAVLSDLRSGKSWQFNGGLSERLGLGRKGSVCTIESIWEEDLFSRIHPDDLAVKYMLELKFFHIMKNTPVSERPDYYVQSVLRMKHEAGRRDDAGTDWIYVKHRLFYINSLADGTLSMALCLYDVCPVASNPEERKDGAPNGMIVNSVTGDIMTVHEMDCGSILSSREKEVLVLIEKGRSSKEIADILSISVHTVSRHRQNILEALNAGNSVEACRMARMMGII